MAPRKNKQASNSKAQPAKKSPPSLKKPPAASAKVVPPSPGTASTFSASSMSLSPGSIGGGVAVGGGGFAGSPGAVPAGSSSPSLVAVKLPAGPLPHQLRASGPSTDTVQRFLKQQSKASLPEGGLQAFGIKKSTTSGGHGNDKDSKLKCVIIRGENDSAYLVFRCEPNNPNYRNGSWSEKAFFDAVRNGHDWVKMIDVDTEMLHWFHNDVAMKNLKDCNIRLFVIHCAEMPDPKNVMELSQFICERVNAMPNNTTALSIDSDNFFWLPLEEDPVWADVVGSDAALKTLVEKKGMPKAGFCNFHKDVIHTCFRPHTFTMDLARVLHAPIEQVHPNLRVEVKVEEDQKPPAEEQDEEDDDGDIMLDAEESDDDDL